jgi:glucose/arabinose dehydrogenase
LTGTIDTLSGFVGEQGQAHGRHFGVVLDRRGALLVAEDFGNVVWRVSATNDRQASR